MSQEYYFQKGGASLPYRWNNPNAQAFAPCETCNSCGKPKKPATKDQQGGGNLPNRWFNPDTTPFGCDTGACDKPLAVYAKEFMESQASQGCKGCGFPCAAKKPQMGGFPTGAPLTIFTEGKPLQYNFNMEDNFTGLPVFVPVRK
jgi:hypothetical protein